MSDNSEHARFSFSSAHIWVNCPASILLKETLPPEPQSEYAALGTEVHLHAGASLKAFLMRKQDGETPLYTYTPALGDPEEIEECINGYVSAIWEKVLRHQVTGKFYEIEDRVVLDEKLDIWGTADFWCLGINDKGSVSSFIVDYKNGMSLVDSDKNPQLAGYSVALREEMRRLGKEVEFSQAAIFQPRANDTPWKETKFSAKQLDSWKSKFIEAASSVIAGKAKFKAGTHCKWCKCKPICKTYAKYCNKETGLTVIAEKAVELPKPETLSDEALKRLKLYGYLIEDFLKDVEAYSINRHKQGLPIQGLKLVSKEGNREWIKDEVLIAKTLKEKGITPYRPNYLITMGSAEKVAKQLEVDISDLITRKASSEILVSSDDERAEVEDATKKLRKLE